MWSSTRFRWLAVPVVVVMSLATACGGDDVSSEDTSTTIEVPDETATVPPTDAQPSTTLVEDYPCSLFDLDELGTILGNDLDMGDGVTNNVSEDNVEYVGQECSWSSSTGEGNELRVQVSEADDFPSGSVDCPPTIGDSTPVSGVGTSAEWNVSAATELEVGTLRVCAPDAFIIVVVDGPVGEDHQTMAVEIADLTLTALA